MELVTGATSSLLPKLGALLQDEYSLQDKVKKDIESLQNELMFMNATLRMVAAVPRDQLDEHVRIWAVFIKELSYDMEDAVNTFVAHVHGAPHLDGLITKVSNMLCMGRTHHEIAGMVDEIKSLIKEVAELRDRYRLDNIIDRPATPVVLLPQMDSTWLFRHLAADREAITRRHEYQVPVGEEDMELLHNWITSDNNNGDTGLLSILGPTGVGKTAIAMSLYRNYGDQFQRRAMVNMSCVKYLNDEEVIMDILSQFKPHELQDNDRSYNELREDLLVCLQGKRFLILLDGVRSPSVLDEFDWLFPRPGNGRVILTTQLDGVGRHSRTDYVHEVGLLSDEKAEHLFMEVVGKENQKEIPPELWKVCAGVPLAIVTMAELVACNPQKSSEEWGELVCTALPPSPSASHTGYQLTRILSTCYSDMSVEIKMCTLYLAIFRLDQKISRKCLTRRWLSNGFVSEQQGLSAEGVAEAYLNHLSRRNFLRAVEHSCDGKVKSYQVTHDKVLEYIVSKASEENFVTTVGGWVMMPSSSKIRRLSVQCKHWEYRRELETVNLSRVRDFTMFGSLDNLPTNSFKFRLVQVLDLEGCKDFKHHHIKEICRMLLLKYLSLRGTDVKKLTEKIGDLRCLETLDIRETNIMELPKSICKLERLVNILGGNKRTMKALKLPMMLGINMKALRVLSGVAIGGDRISYYYFTKSKCLQKLAIYKIISAKGDPDFMDLISFIKYFHDLSLRALVINDESSEFFKSYSDCSDHPKLLNALELSGKLVELPKWIVKMDALTKLTLSLTALRADNLEVLSKICSLLSLTFSLHVAKQDQEIDAIIEDNKACSDGVILFSVGGFENLKLLRFIAPYVPQLSFPDGAVPTLEKLELRCSNFDGLVGIRGLKHLQQAHIKIHGETSEATESIIKEMGTAAREDREGPRIIFD